MIKIQYNTSRYNFAETLSQRLDTDLHKITRIGSDVTPNALNEDKWHIDAQCWIKSHIGVYDLFVREVIYPIFCEPIMYQVVPCIRLHYDGCCDVVLDDPIGPTRFYVPLTDSYASNSIQSIDLIYGQMVMYKGKCDRVINTTGQCRLSLEFNVMPKSMIGEFEVGCYKLLEI